jgi:hypothetical protein
MPSTIHHLLLCTHLSLSYRHGEPAATGNWTQLFYSLVSAVAALLCTFDCLTQHTKDALASIWKELGLWSLCTNFSMTSGTYIERGRHIYILFLLSIISLSHFILRRRRRTALSRVCAAALLLL